MANVPNNHYAEYSPPRSAPSDYPPMGEPRDEPSLGELFSELSSEVTTLVKQEVQLAKTELSAKASKAGRNIGFLAAGGFIAYAGFIMLLVAFAAILALFMETWLATLIVGLVVTGVGAILVKRGIDALRKMNPAPEKTIETLQEDKEWIKEQVQ